MATDNVHKYGFRWIRSMFGEPFPKAQRYRLATGYTKSLAGGAVDLRVGDPVTLLSTGYIQHQVGSEGTQLGNTGIVVGFGPVYDGSVMQVVNHFTAGGGAYGTNLEHQTYVWVVPGIGSIFECDADDNVTALTEATYLSYIGENVDHVLTTGSEPLANPMLDISTHAVTATLLWRILDISQAAENVDFAGKYVKLLVTPNVAQQSTLLGI